MKHEEPYFACFAHPSLDHTEPDVLPLHIVTQCPSLALSDQVWKSSALEHIHTPFITCGHVQ